jgi:hypothetical protein
MSKAPAFQFYAGDRAMDIMGLDNEAVGAWTRAMMYLWTNGPTPSDRLQQVAGRGWERVAFLFSTFEAGLGLVWQEELREKQRVFREKASSFGTKGGRPSKEEKGTLSKKQGYLKGTQRVRSMKKEDEVEEKKEERAGEKTEAVLPVEVYEVIQWPTFDDFWTAYERKGSRKVAEQEWRRLTQADKEALMPRIPEYFRAKPDKVYRKDGERFIKHRTWEDEFTISQPRTNGTSGQSVADKAAGAMSIIRSGLL